MKKIMVTGLIFGLAFSSIIVRGVTGQETAGQILAKLNNLSPEKRQKALIEGAKLEGELTIYSGMRQDQLVPFSKMFNKRFPFLKVNAFRVAGRRAVIKTQTEFRAGQHLVDVVNGRSTVGYALKMGGILDPYFSPQRKFIPAAYKDKEGYFPPLYVIPVVLGYNPNLVKPSEVPKRYEDLLDPKWKGKIFLDTEDFEWFTVLLNQFGREKGLKFMKKLAKQDLSLRRGRTLQTQLLLAGERYMAVALHAHSVLDFKEKGAPIDWTILDPYFAKVNVITLIQHAPHPYAAALYIDWSLSEEGQSKITTFGRVVTRKGIKQRFPELLKKEYIIVSAKMIGPVLARTIKEYQEIFMRGR